MEAHFHGVSLGASESGSNGSKTWAHDLELSVGGSGITVAGGEGTQASTLPWSAVRQFSPGFTLAFPDGRPATELEVALADRSLTFLVPADQLSPSLVVELVHLAPARSPHAGSSGTQPHPPFIPAPPELIAARPPTKSANRKRKTGLVVVLATTAVVALVAVVAVVTLGGGSPSKTAANTNTTAGRHKRPVTPTTSPVPTHELSGPPASMTPSAATAAVLIRDDDLHNWQSNGDAAPEIAGQPQASAQSTTNDPFLPAASSVIEPSFSVLQQCSNLPLDHMQLFTGNYYSGGPPTWNSNSYNPSNSNPSQLSVTPQLFSIASEVATPADQQGDLAAIASPTFPSCFGSFLVSELRAVYGQEGGTVDSLTSKASPVTQVPGVETLEFDVSAQLVVSGDVFNFRNRFVLMGSGRLEELLEGYDSTNKPIPSRTWSVLLSTLQHRMEGTAGMTAKPVKNANR